jgi:hypothetical protein
MLRAAHISPDAPIVSTLSNELSGYAWAAASVSPAMAAPACAAAPAEREAAAVLGGGPVSAVPAAFSALGHAPRPRSNAR